MDERVALTIAVTGATGFVGEHLTRRLRRVGHVVRALTRRRNNDDSDPKLIWIQGDLSSGSSLKDLVSGADVVVHAAGAIKALSRSAFFKINKDGTQSLVEAALNAKVPRFILVSSLAAREPSLSPYAASKRAGELVLDRFRDRIESVVLRPSAIYGPGDQETGRLFHMANNGFILAPGSPAARLSLVHVGDVVTAIQACCELGQPSRPLEIDDGAPGGYTWRELADVAGGAVNRPPKLIYLPPVMVWLAGAAGTAISLITRKPSILTLAKVPELLHTDWHARGSRPNGWKPAWALGTGFNDAVDWYSSQNILKRYF
ncbi:MAG: NAD-dependent epimerase/dehydratase family protein [Rhodospirillaceae bacterium]|nr:NAD-dependent epimerase/dehydratase family protein [Rhodospirillaceae bacterium]